MWPFFLTGEAVHLVLFSVIIRRYISYCIFEVTSACDPHSVESQRGLIWQVVN